MTITRRTQQLKVGVLSTRDLRGIERCLLYAFGLEAVLLAEIDLAAQPATFVQSLAEKTLIAAVAMADINKTGVDLPLLQKILQTN